MWWYISGCTEGDASEAFELTEFTLLLNVDVLKVCGGGVWGTEGGARGSSFASNKGVDGAEITGEEVM